jgi:hypothetical protein
MVIRIILEFDELIHELLLDLSLFRKASWIAVSSLAISTGFSKTAPAPDSAILSFSSICPPQPVLYDIRLGFDLQVPRNPIGWGRKTFKVFADQ